MSMGAKETNSFGYTKDSIPNCTVSAAIFFFFLLYKHKILFFRLPRPLIHINVNLN